MLKAGLTPIVIFNGVLWLFFTFAYFYQFAYIIRVIMHGDVRLPKAKKNHSYAFVIAAHNEEPVIANLVRSILTQNYDGLIDCFVVADACTDATAEEAKRAGAITWERNDLARKGKSWVLDYAFDRILNEYGDKYEAFFIMDADNIISPNYVAIMNQAFDAGYLVCTSYRNSKNFDSSWISSAYATWFLREAKFLNNARMMLGTSCAISGSGWLVSARPRHARLALPHLDRGHPVLNLLLRPRHPHRLRPGRVLRRAAAHLQGVLDTAHALDQGVLPGILLV